MQDCRGHSEMSMENEEVKVQCLAGPWYQCGSSQ